MPDWRPIGDNHVWETHQRRRHATSETDMPDWRPIGDLDMLHRRLRCLIGYPSQTHRTPTCPITNWHSHRRLTCLRSLIGMWAHIYLNIYSYFYILFAYLWIHENFIFIEGPLETYHRPIGDRHAWSATHQRHRHASSETHLKPTCTNILFHYI